MISPPPIEYRRSKSRRVTLAIAGALMFSLLALPIPAKPPTDDSNRHPVPEAHPSSTVPVEWDGVSAERLLTGLPADLPTNKRELARAAIFEVAPRLHELSNTFITVCDELRELSFNQDTPPETLTKLGQKLSHSRKALRKELHKLNRRLEHLTGYNLKLDNPGLPDKPMTKRLRAQ